MNQERILIVEDEANERTGLAELVSSWGYRTDTAADGVEALEKVGTFAPSIVITDIKMPRMDGMELVEKLADLSQSIAVVMVTAKGAESDRVHGFELGADDYVVKPFSVRELLLRVEAVLRRLVEDVSTDSILIAGGIRIDPARHEVTAGGESVILTPLEFRLLQTLLERPGRIQTRETLLSDVWGIDAEIETRTVDTHIKRLRQKLGPSGESIETIRGVGYRLRADSG